MELIELYLPSGEQLEFQIALVDEPAIESNFMAFKKEGRFQFKEVDKSERKLMGYFMIADMEILRVDPKRGAYNVKFPKKSIDTIVENFAYNGLNRNMNEMHQTNQLAEGVYVLSYWQIDSAKGITAPNGFKTEADGSFFGIVKCDNDEVYQKALNGEYNGFSIEGKFIEQAIDKYFKQSEPDTKSIYSKIKNKMTKEVQSFFEALMSHFNEENKQTPEHKFEELLLVDGETKVTIEPEVAVGSAIALYSADGTPVPAPVGSYELQDGRVIVVEADGVIASITDPTAEGEEELADDKTKADPAKGNEAVKRLIERIEKVSEFEKQIAELKSENESFKKETDFLHKESDELKLQFSELQKLTKETFDRLLSQDSKAPVQEPKRAFKLEKKTNNLYNFLND